MTPRKWAKIDLQWCNLSASPNNLSTDQSTGSLQHKRLLTDDASQGTSATYDDYKPRYVTPSSPEAQVGVAESAGSPKRRRALAPKVARPRFLATELRLRERLFVGVVTSRQTAGSLAVALNRSVAEYVSKMVFFIEGEFLVSSVPVRLLLKFAVMSHRLA